MNIQASAGPLDYTVRDAKSDAHIDAIGKLAEDWYGLSFDPAKRNLVYSRLSKRLKKLGLSDFGAYLDLIQSEAGAEESAHLVSALTTNVTNFFREEHHFDFLRTEILPGLLSATRHGPRVRIWSAGCSIGAEPYSIALTLRAAKPRLADQDVKILATDIDPVVVARGRQGHYQGPDASGLPDDVDRTLVDLSDGPPRQAQFKSPIRDLVHFKQLNLMGDWPMKGPFDVIFCRNVAIYFDLPTQARLWRRFAQLLPVGGHLFIGHSERVKDPASLGLQPVGYTTYCKTG